MLRPIRQVIVAVLVALVLAHRAAAAEPVSRDAHYAKQLSGECDALMQSAVKRPYGWAWDNVPAGAASSVGAAARAPRHVTLEPQATPAAGLMLLYAGQFLNEPKYTQAALEAAKGLSAAQLGNGKIPQHAMFGPTSGNGRDEPSFIADRGSTAASLSLLLAVSGSVQDRPEAITRATNRAIHWLMAQQSDDGGWPVGYPPDAPPRDAQRLIRLDGSDYRDCTYALLLAADATHEPVVDKAARRSVAKLLSLRLVARGEAPTTEPAEANRFGVGDLPPQAATLWSSAYKPNGAIDPKLSEFPPGADVVASRFAVQTLLGAYLVTGERSFGQALDAACKSLDELKTSDGRWRRVYLTTPTTAPTTDPAAGGGMFAPPPDHSGPWMVGSFDVQPTLGSVRQLKVLGKEQYAAMLAVNFTVGQHLASSICGLNDQPMSMDLPVAKAEVKRYTETHADLWTALDEPPSENLQAKTRRLWLLLIRARLEAMTGGA